jgi:hypothetical protein
MGFYVFIVLGKYPNCFASAYKINVLIQIKDKLGST